MSNGGSHCITRSLRVSAFASLASFMSAMSFFAGSIWRNDIPFPSGRHVRSRLASGSNGAGAIRGSGSRIGLVGSVTVGWVTGMGVPPAFPPPLPCPNRPPFP